jgi:hypothetical protein
VPWSYVAAKQAVAHQPRRSVSFVFAANVIAVARVVLILTEPLLWASTDH